MSGLIRQAEEEIARRTIRALVAAGYTLAVDDGEEIAVKDTTNESALMEALFATDESWLHAYGRGRAWTPRSDGWVRFVYGNGGFDVICDYSTNLEAVLKPVNDYADSLS